MTRSIVFGLLLLCCLVGSTVAAQVKPQLRSRAKVIQPPNRSVQINAELRNPSAVRIADKSRIQIARPEDKPTPDLHPGGRQPSEPAPNPNAHEELEREGPSNKPFHITDNLVTDVDFTGDRILNLFGTVFRDGNIKSGYFYYLPAAYNLGWSATTGEYAFNVTYGAASASGPGRTTVTAILEPGLNKTDVEIARKLLLTDIKGKPEAGFGVKELIALPMAQSPEIEFTNLSQFGVQASDISLRAPSDLSDPIYLSFTTDQIDALMAMFFNNIGLYGDVIVYPDGAGMPASIRIPFNLKIDDPGTFGKFQLQGTDWRTNWRNPSDYPVILDHLHVMRKEGSGYQVYSWSAENVTVPEGAKVEFGANSVPAWIDTDPKVERIWLAYAIAACNSCNKAVKQKILGSINPNGVAQPKKLEFTILTPVSFTKASLIKIKIRSFQATASGDTKQELPSLTVTEDGTVLDGGVLYVRNGSVDFEYQLQVYLEDGTRFASAWIPSNNRELVIGSRQIKDHIPEFADQ